MLHRRRGQIVFVSSLAGLVGLYGYSAYAASKFAVVGMAQSLRQELSDTGVSAHQKSPGVLVQVNFLLFPVYELA